MLFTSVDLNAERHIMKYSEKEVLQYVQEDDVKFVRLAFCDVFGKQKNIAIIATELPRAFEQGIAIDASSVAGFGGHVRSDLLLFPHAETISELPWRPDTGKVVRMFCDLRLPDGTPFVLDTRHMLSEAVKDACDAGLRFSFGTEMEFYLFKNDEDGKPTKEPYDTAGYMDIAPEDKGENVRREICLMLEKMGLSPEASHHEEGPGQNEIDFRYSSPVVAADNAVTFSSVVKAIAARNGLTADFSPKPLPEAAGNGMHINFSIDTLKDEADEEMKDQLVKQAIAGIMDNACAMTVFMNHCIESYERLGGYKAPGYISWSEENRSQLIRIPAARAPYKRAELRSADPLANPYIAFTLLIRAGLKGIRKKMQLSEPADFDMFTASSEVLSNYEHLPKTLQEAKDAARQDAFIRDVLPEELIAIYCSR